MTKKHELALALIALHQIDLSWDRDKLTAEQYHPERHSITEIICVPIEYTLTRHSDALAKVLDAIVDKFGQGIKYE